ncbi:hypothetical protein DVH24_017167 [Malus domestica]|uniref:Uncharacterized protein n=1 Tax=Malus domestica TaxID=3750 RepID=A0A498IVG3_MALDO|nr:hypothetical protein DVH24_017167 [Malus domestica]
MNDTFSHPLTFSTSPPLAHSYVSSFSPWSSSEAIAAACPARPPSLPSSSQCGTLPVERLCSHAALRP